MAGESSLVMKLASYLPEVEPPKQKRLSFKEKLKWTGIVLGLFFILGMIPLYGLGPNYLEQFEYLSIILGAKFGSLISLGIGPIVTASIVLQLLQGSGILKIDLNTKEGKQYFQGLQKLLTIFFVVFESIVYVMMGGLRPAPGMSPWVLVIQLCMGGFFIMLMDEVVSKWGFGSGVGLFIAAGVSKTIAISAFSWLPGTVAGVGQYASGAVPRLFQALRAADPITAGLALAAILATLAVFLIAVYAQAMKIEIPLSFGRIRGHGVRWPLSFLYTSNIPVILVAALLANIQLWARLLERANIPILGTFDAAGRAASGFVFWVSSPNIIGSVIKGSLTPVQIWQALAYMGFMITGAVIFSLFWMKTSGLDPKSQAERIMASGLQVPGFRKDRRVLERLLGRYILPLTVMGAITVGFLAALADLTGALSRGTGILLTVMIIYRLYEDITRQHLMDMNPLLRRFVKQ
ncbi:preprotein translocase subunit SecY [Candidatus Woesearchaeota archaeon]|nr:preprotein translocase subunit SecY [Candidatus Woesearchaeota archaeon]RLE43620.1 MAG: preprotein translocase subunit SecY [Candidatus Woesearchaeota archaeon]